MTGPIPSWNKVPLTGKYADAKGNPLTGTIRFTPSVRVADVTDRVMVVPATFEAVLDAEGAFSIELPATDDPDIVPSGFTYTVVEEITGGETYSIELSVTALPGGVDLTIAARAVPVPAVVTYVTFAQLNAAMASGELNGASAYDVAVSNGYLGTESEWLLSLQADMSIVNSKASIPALAEKVMFVTPRGNDANDGATLATAKATIQSALAALEGPGLIQLGYGTIATSSVIDVSNRRGVEIRGVGGLTAGSTPATILQFNGTGSGAIIDAGSSIGFKLRDVMVIYTNAGFTGLCVDLRLTPARTVATGLAVIEGCYIGGSGVRTAAAAIGVDNAMSSQIISCNLVGNQVGVLGRSVTANFSNAISILGTQFLSNEVAHIRNMGEAWVVEGCTFEARTDGSAGAIKQDAGFNVRGVQISGNWFGDVLAAKGGVQIDIAGTGFSIFGNMIGINTTATAVRVAGGSSGFSITGNYITGGNSGDTGIEVPTSCLNYDTALNTLVNIATPITSAPAFSIDRVASFPLLRLHNMSSIDGSAVIRFQADRATAKQYDLGIDNGGGTTKAFGLYDATAAAMRWRVPTQGGFVVNPATLATTATDGFFYAPVMTGPPTGAPTAQAGGAAVVVEDSATPKIWVRIGSTWKSAALA